MIIGKAGRLILYNVLAGEGWKCQACLENDSDICTDCKESWLQEVVSGVSLEYSDAYERRLGTTAGLASCVMGITGALGNASMGLWEEGDLLKLV